MAAVTVIKVKNGYLIGTDGKGMNEASYFSTLDKFAVIEIERQMAEQTKKASAIPADEIDALAAQMAAQMGMSKGEQK